MKGEMCKKVRTLLRVSSRQQLHDDDIPVQRAEAAQYIAGRPDWVFDKEYIEKAVSGYKNNVKERAVLQEILADARTHAFDVLLAYMSDRIGRQEEYSFYVAALNRLGIEVWTIKDGQLKTEEHVDKLLNYIRFWQNEGESKKTGMRVRDTQRELVKAGKFVGGRAPYGYRLIASGMVSNHGRLLKKLEIVEEKAQVVRQIYHLAVYQGLGYAKIARHLNEQAIPAVTAGEWKAGTIRSILTNPVYMGYLAFNRRVSADRQGGYTRQDRKEWIYSDRQIEELVIVPPQVWERAQEIREARKERLGAAKKNPLEAYARGDQVPFCTGGKLALTGLAVCGYCGKRLKNGSYCNHWTTKAGEKKSAYTGRYVCPQRCEKRSCYSQNYLEGIVFEAVENCMEHLKAVDVAKELQCRKDGRRKRLQRELEDLQKRQRALRLDLQTLEEKIPEALRGTCCFSTQKLSGMIVENERKQEELTKREQEIRQKLTRMSEMSGCREPASIARPDWKTVWKDADTQTKKMLLSALIGEICVREDEIRIRLKVRPGDLSLQKKADSGVSESGI